MIRPEWNKEDRNRSKIDRCWSWWWNAIRIYNNEMRFVPTIIALSTFTYLYFVMPRTRVLHQNPLQSFTLLTPLQPSSIGSTCKNDKTFWQWIVFQSCKYDRMCLKKDTLCPSANCLKSFPLEKKKASIHEPRFQSICATKLGLFGCPRAPGEFWMEESSMQLASLTKSLIRAKSFHTPWRFDVATFHVVKARVSVEACSLQRARP